ncbi:hypothetical protein GW17_00023687 [Ensete ventricosum]|nr:hypothetical protein GW17_00023687 [Ensete ventricosum]
MVATLFLRRLLSYRTKPRRCSLAAIAFFSPAPVIAQASAIAVSDCPPSAPPLLHCLLLMPSSSSTTVAAASSQLHPPRPLLHLYTTTDPLPQLPPSHTLLCAATQSCLRQPPSSSTAPSLPNRTSCSPLPNGNRAPSCHYRQPDPFAAQPRPSLSPRSLATILFLPRLLLLPAPSRVSTTSVFLPGHYRCHQPLPSPPLANQPPSSSPRYCLPLMLPLFPLSLAPLAL